MTAALDDLVALLDLESIEVNIFRGVSPKENRQRVFGGQVAGQALVAAGRTVEQGDVHSLHAYFLRPGDPSVPILYDVDRIRDGRSFTTRRVVAIQHGKAIFNLSASFHRNEPDQPDRQVPVPDVPAPESLPTFQERMAPFKERMGDWYTRPRPIDQRWVDGHPFDAEERQASVDNRQRVWIRADGRLPDDPLLHACVVAYASDMSLLDTTMPNGGWDDRIMAASLDHAMWFHRPFRADEWLLYDQESPITTGARGLARGQIFATDGRLVVSVVQEGLVRMVTGARPAG